MSFFSLSPELRNQIYGYATDNEMATLIDYAGLYMSCQQIKHEMEHEGLRLLHIYLKSKLSTTPGIRIDLPTTLSEGKNLSISLSTKVWVCSVSVSPYPAAVCGRARNRPMIE